MSDDKRYAPIIIPTLNRIDHLRRCINSLSENPFCKKTELFISVDYPPNETYLVGYKEVKEYVKGITGFKKVNCYFQEENLGPTDNTIFLRNAVKSEGYDRFIFTEDDNEFSANFIEYMDRFLYGYEKSDYVFAISSTGISGLSTKNDYFFRHYFHAWGVGQWIYKREKADDWISNGQYEELVYSPIKMTKLFFSNTHRFCDYASDILREAPAMRDNNGIPVSMDYTLTIYQIINNKVNVFPTKRKSRNWGTDGTGVNSGYEDVDVSKIALDRKTRFTSITRNRNLKIYSAISELLLAIKQLPSIRRVIRSVIVIIARQCLNDEYFSLFRYHVHYGLFQRFKNR